MTRTATRFACLNLLWLFVPVPAGAGAWTVPADETRIMAGVFASRASEQFGNRGHPSQPIDFTKIYTQVYAEYGWSDALTLIAAPEFETAKWRSPGNVGGAKWNVAMSGGMRYRLFSGFGTLSLEGNLKSAGTYNEVAIAGGRLSPGREIELRILYGTNFEFAGYDGFADFEGGHRWIAGDRANEVPMDVTLGLHLTPGLMVLVQSFNVISAGPEPGLGRYRSHKIAVSAVQGLGDMFSLQIGAFYAPLGQNSLREQGLMAVLWARF